VMNRQPGRARSGGEGRRSRDRACGVALGQEINRPTPERATTGMRRDQTDLVINDRSSTNATCVSDSDGLSTRSSQNSGAIESGLRSGPHLFLLRNHLRGFEPMTLNPKTFRHEAVSTFFLSSSELRCIWKSAPNRRIIPPPWSSG
jgi:hypothetical protein